MKPTFTVYYRDGGEQRCRWTRVAESYATAEAAQAKVAEIATAGRKALYAETDIVDIIGLPIGWTADPAFDWEPAGHGWFTRSARPTYEPRRAVGASFKTA